MLDFYRLAILFEHDSRISNDHMSLVLLEVLFLSIRDKLMLLLPESSLIYALVLAILELSHSVYKISFQKVMMAKVRSSAMVAVSFRRLALLSIDILRSRTLFQSHSGASKSCTRRTESK